MSTACRASWSSADRGRRSPVGTLDIANGRVFAVHLVVNPDKLHWVLELVTPDYGPGNASPRRTIRANSSSGVNRTTSATAPGSRWPRSRQSMMHTGTAVAHLIASSAPQPVNRTRLRTASSNVNVLPAERAAWQAGHARPHGHWSTAERHAARVADERQAIRT